MENENIILKKQTWTDYTCLADKHLTRSSPLSFGCAFLTNFSLSLFTVFLLSLLTTFLLSLSLLFYFRFSLVLSSLHGKHDLRLNETVFLLDWNFEHAQVRYVSHSWHMPSWSRRKWPDISTIASIWRENMLRYLFANIICAKSFPRA